MSGGGRALVGRGGVKSDKRRFKTNGGSRQTAVQDKRRRAKKVVSVVWSVEGR